MPSQEFVDIVTVYVDRLVEEGMFGTPIKGVTFKIQYAPTQEQLELVNVEPGNTLLGLYTKPPATVTLFEESIRGLSKSIAHMHQKVSEVLNHEVYFHHLGYNHCARE